MPLDELTDPFIAFLDILAPPRCTSCDLPIEAIDRRTSPLASLLCPLCEELVERAKAAVLPARGPLDGLSSVWIYGGPLADLVLAMKHGDRPGLVRRVGRAARRVVPAPACDRIVPVPLARRRIVSRGFNQAGLLASVAARGTGGRLAHGALVRTRETPSQGRLGPAARRRNVAGAFRVPASWRRRIEGRVVLVVDDVWTTGATVTECARVLAGAGAARVVAWTVARVE